LTYGEGNSEDDLKKYFPYHKLKTLSNLQDGLPTLEDFWDPIREINQLDEPFLRFENLKKRGFSDTEILKTMKLKSFPIKGCLLYESLLQKWKEENINNMFELAKNYCLYDIKPLLKVAINFFKLIFQDTGICAQKSTLSLQQLARLECLKLSGMSDDIYLVTQKWHFRFASNLTGGISDIVSRRFNYFLL